MSDFFTELGLNNAAFASAALHDRAAHGRVVLDGAVAYYAPGWYASAYSLPFNGAFIAMGDLARFGGHLLAASNDPSATLHAMTHPSQGDDYGLGLVHRTRQKPASLEHDGSGQGFYARLIVLPEHNLTLAIACNGGNESRNEANRFFELTDEMVQILVERPDQTPTAH